MPTNLELKAKIVSLSRTFQIAKRIAQSAGVLSQTDTYYEVRRGRLKLREFSKRKAELIYYSRNKKKGDRWSNYQVFPVKNAVVLKEILDKSLGRKVVVRKKRSLFFYKNARIHIDTVSGIGNFIEFEVKAMQKKRLTREIYDELVEVFKVRKKDVLQCSYADLLQQRNKI